MDVNLKRIYDIFVAKSGRLIIHSNGFHLMRNALFKRHVQIY